ncbi:MAG: hypothetical protein IPG04_16060 [Polyangiaceae bacterium]|jgi:hypothetical protein|nr:hypothetical protein [Polyangiaceae bacterium]
MRSLPRLLCALLLALALSACAGMAEYPLGIPASSTSKFYAAMEAVAASRGMMISKHPTSLNVQTKDGDWLQYMQRQDALVLVVIADTEGLSDAQIEERKAQLKALSDELVSEARKTAWEAKAFD